MRMLRSVLVLVMVVGTWPSLAAAHPAVGTAARCDPTSYDGRHGVVSYHRRAVVTHGRRIVVAPKSTSVRNPRVPHLRTVTATANAAARVNGRLRWIWRSVDRHFDVHTRPTGAHTSNHSATVHAVVHNTTAHREVLVAYVGVVEYYGRVYRTSCAATGSGGTVAREQYRYTNWALDGEGYISCTGGAPTLLAAAAIREFCH